MAANVTAEVDTSVLYVEYITLALECIIGYFAVLCWTRGRLANKINPNSNKHKDTNIHLIRLLNLTALIFFILTCFFIILNEYDTSNKKIYLDHFILICEIVMICAFAWCIRISSINYFTSMCLIEETYDTGDVIKRVSTTFAVGFGILYWIVYLLPVFAGNNNYMVAAGTAVFYYNAVFAFILCWVLAKLRAILVKTFALVQVECCDYFVVFLKCMFHVTFCCCERHFRNVMFVVSPHFE